MSKSVREQVVDFLSRVGGSANLDEITSSFEKPRSSDYVDKVLDELQAEGELIEEANGDKKRTFSWLRGPEKEPVPELHEIAPSIKNLVESGVWTSKDGLEDCPGIFINKRPGQRCAWTVSYDGVPGYSSPLELIGDYELSQSALQYECLDALAMPFHGDHMAALGVLAAEPRPWSPNHEKAILNALVGHREHYIHHLPHWLLEATTKDPWGKGLGRKIWTLPFQSFAGTFRHGWADYEASHNYAQLR